VGERSQAEINENLGSPGGENMSDRIFEVEHRPGEEWVLRFKSPKFYGLSDSTRQHMLAAQKEILLTLRSILDVAIERTEKSSEARKRKRTKIEVQ
jgi:hypothetical protein